MTDADYLFRGSCLDSLPKALSGVQGPLAFPRFVNTQISHDLGDAAIAQVDGPDIYDVTDDQFFSRRMRRAIGGIQIYRGATARSDGYLPPGPGGHPRIDGERFLACRCDTVFRRRQVRTKGVAVELPGVFRIRHSQCGRLTPGLSL